MIVDSEFLTIECIREKCKLLSFILLNPKPTSIWFEDDEFEIIEKVFVGMEYNHFEVIKKEYYKKVIEMVGE